MEFTFLIVIIIVIVSITLLIIIIITFHPLNYLLINLTNIVEFVVITAAVIVEDSYLFSLHIHQLFKGLN